MSFGGPRGKLRQHATRKMMPYEHGCSPLRGRESDLVMRQLFVAGDTGAGENCERVAWKPTLTDTVGIYHGGSADRLVVDKLHVNKLRAL